MSYFSGMDGAVRAWGIAAIVVAVGIGWWVFA